ncbi:EscU/YscU/HrcU family type III secretion system export apparatus switch protein [Paramicrobacterium agarici]|uniref:Flagellar biosynthetic protein FlhB n=1 Tax=Paramicrobacterium agarici TaxID=630514 RepID=A0A2A9DW68_9MICO|nr:EscU/YscU/HrcU family type III secretion system export apparatus switch protein [Microbacterium agarici]PFG30591.1 flagellar biosynthetic protein FlhB [Microbacterium agarici]
MAESDSGERSEKATEKHLREARQKGQLSRSQDLTAWVGIAAAAVMMPVAIAAGASTGTEQMITVAGIASDPDPQKALAALTEGFADVASVLGPMFAVVAVAILIAAVAQGGVHLKKMTGRFEQFNLVSGAKRVFGLRSLWEGAKALLKTAAIGGALWIVIAGLMPVLMSSGSHSVTQLLQSAAGGTAGMLQAAIAVGIGLAVIDLFVVMKRNRKHTRMTKREVKDENKNSDGDPLIRQQRRSRQLAMSRNRMIAAVTDADVVMVNPTHVAVALKYEPGKAAPRVVAKGAGVVAARIREKADEDGVPMVQDVPLTRAIHAACQLGQEIPAELYNAVARVLVFVMSLKKRGAARGIHSLPPRRKA